MVGTRLLVWGTAVLATSQVFCISNRNISSEEKHFHSLFVFLGFRSCSPFSGSSTRPWGTRTRFQNIQPRKSLSLPPQDGLFLASVRSFCSVLAASAWGTHLVGLVRQFRFNATYLTMCRGFDMLFWTRCFFGSQRLEFPHRATARIRYERGEVIAWHCVL